MKSILVTSVVVVAGTLLTLVQALGADKFAEPATQKHSKIPTAALSHSGDTLLNTDAHQTNPSNIWKSKSKFDLDALPVVNRQDVQSHYAQHRRSYDTPMFLGKRDLKNLSLRFKRATDLEDLDATEFSDDFDKRGVDIPQFIGRRRYDTPQFIGRRGYGVPAFVGKRAFRAPAFIGKKAFGAPAFIGKKAFDAPSFVGKRKLTAPSFIGKRGLDVPAFVGRRAYAPPQFIGRRGMDVPAFVGKREFQTPMFLGKRAFSAPSFVGKRGLDAPTFIGKRKEESFRDLLATLQAYREYRRLMQTDKRFDAPLFVGKRSDYENDNLAAETLSRRFQCIPQWVFRMRLNVVDLNMSFIGGYKQNYFSLNILDDVQTKILLPLDDLHKVDSSKMDVPTVQLWDADMPRPNGARFLKLDPAHALGFLGQEASPVSKRYLEFVGKRDNDKRYAEFVGKRAGFGEKRYSRGSLSEYLSKRLRIRRPEFVGKRSNQKRYLEFIGR
ncbi:hypothetical protein LOTGIDRAFT_167943 [Lottia gigantea]|uniref:Uncharacterized protein n=1 Tax=Lottia gigantea TaxID=225164 RepID=V3ZW32_LOTGI|nr:hypothetical protein LOTGIDRAFT_167943 [Lottia gigantea]ESO85156.1 hypothetical protein LOTGIDRAFT_167943 [Lottia gigantea]